MTASRVRFATFALAATLGACGSATGLEDPTPWLLDGSVAPPPPPPPRDGGIDAPRDVGPRIDVGPIDAGPLPPPDVCVELPPHEPPSSIEVSFVSRIGRADVLFLVDTTGSMGTTIEQIRLRLRDTIVPGIAASLSDVQLSVAGYADFPTEFDVGDVPFTLYQSSTADLALVQGSLDALFASGGGDTPESGVEALHSVATGTGVDLVEPRRCPGGTIGMPCFRVGTTPIILMFTDATSHNGPGGAESYSTWPAFRWDAAEYEQTVGELRAIGAKVLGIHNGWDTTVQPVLERLARDTGAVRADGSPIYFYVGAGAETLGPEVVAAVQSLVDEVPIDVDVLVEDWPGDAIDANEFVTGIVAVSATPPSGATRLADRFVGVLPGTRVLFSVLLANESFPRGPEPLSFRMNVVLRGDGVTRLTETAVDIVIPALDGDGCP